MPTTPVLTRAAALAAAGVLMFGAGITFAPSAAAADPPPEDPVEKAVLDTAQLIYPMPEGMEYYWSGKERVEGFLGLNGLPGGPLGEFPQPANPDNPNMPGGPGYGAPGMIADATGVNPRPPGGGDENGRPARTTLGPLVLPLCDSPQPCDLTPVTTNPPN